MLGDDNAASDGGGVPDYLWFQRPALGPRYTFTLAIGMLLLVLVQYTRRLAALKQKLGPDEFKGSLRFCEMIAAYADNDEPTFTVARMVTKSLFFLGLLEINYQKGFFIMMAILVFESTGDIARVLLGYWNCKSLQDVHPTSEEEAKSIAASTQLEPSNVYEDISRPKLIAFMVFLVQSMLIGIVMLDSYSTPTRTCFNGVATDACPMLSSLGSYCLYFLGTFMACVFYVGPMNSYGKKEHDPVFWLKLFLMSKQTASVLSWQDPTTNKAMRMRLRQHDWRIWVRFFMSFVVNSICFHFLLHVLPIQIASKNSVMGVVFSSVGMIYLVDLDDTSGTVMTLVQHEGTTHVPLHPTDTVVVATTGGYQSVGSTTTTGNGIDMVNFEREKQKLVEESMKDLKIKLEALASGYDPRQTQNVRFTSVTHAILLSRQKKGKQGNNDEEARLLA